MEKERKSSITNKGLLGILSIILLMLLLTGAGGYTYAKYLAQEKGTGGAEVANWSFEIAKDGQATKTVNLASTVNKNTLVNGKIAPGTSGKFSITLDATGSDVAVDYLLAFINEKNKPQNIVFKYNDRTTKSLGEIGDIKGNISIKGDKKTTIEIEWTWPYETGSTYEEKEKNDITDTNNGISPLDYTFEILAQGTQSV